LEPKCVASLDDCGNVSITVGDSSNQADLKQYKAIEEVPLDSIELSIFGHRFMSIAE
jgi:hypothetical protein